MKAATREWIRKAESDYQLAVSLMRRRKLPVRDHVCFHVQQSAEKYVKARLEEAGLPFPRTHDIAALLQAAAPVEPLWPAMTVAARRLNKRSAPGRKVDPAASACDPASMSAANLSAWEATLTYRENYRLAPFGLAISAAVRNPSTSLAYPAVPNCSVTEVIWSGNFISRLAKAPIAEWRNSEFSTANNQTMVSPASRATSGSSFPSFAPDAHSTMSLARSAGDEKLKSIDEDASKEADHCAESASAVRRTRRVVRYSEFHLWRGRTISQERRQSYQGGLPPKDG